MATCESNDSDGEGKGEGKELRQLNEKLDMIRDRVRGVALGYSTGLLVFGERGVGKTHTVLGELDTIKHRYVLHNTQLTPKGLFEALSDERFAVHVVEDMEGLTKNRVVQSLLRSALWAHPGKPRLVTWTTARDGRREVDFRGGIVMTANANLGDTPELRAVASRITVAELVVTRAEMYALMRHLAARGDRSDLGWVDATLCLQVTEFVIGECVRAKVEPDMRLWVNAIREDFLQWRAKETRRSWKERVRARIARKALAAQDDLLVVPTKREEVLGQKDVLRQILLETTHLSGPEQTELRVRLFTERTGAKKSTYYSRLKSLKAELRAELRKDGE